MYTHIDFATKKQLRDAVKQGRKVSVYQPNDMFGKTDAVQQGTHTITLEGPHYPQPHRWYAEATVVDGCVTKVK